MKTNKIFSLALVMATGMAVSSCGDDFLEAEPTAQISVGGTVDQNSLFASLVAAYQPLLFESYAACSYESPVFIGEIQGDNCWKGGGDAQDGNSGQNLNISLFTTSGNSTLNGTWTLFYSGIARTNAVISGAANAVIANDKEAENIARYKAEAHFLRAYYYYILWRSFGNIPYFTDFSELNDYTAPQLKADDIYAKILEDLEEAIKDDVLPINLNNVDGQEGKGHATLAAALMLRARVIMYQKDSSKYQQASDDLKRIIDSGEYELVPTEELANMWTVDGEFGKESIFEINHLGENSQWGGWSGYGNNLPSYISPNGLEGHDDYRGGWGFAPVRPDAVDRAFKTGDNRKAISVVDHSEYKYTARWQDTGLFFGKYAAHEGDINHDKEAGAPDLNSTANVRIFRYAETLLNYAELYYLNGVGEPAVAKKAFNDVHSRAFDGESIDNPTANDVKAEQHAEFFGEGHRYYDLVRWGDAAAALTGEVLAVDGGRTWTENKKYVAIPQSEIDKTKGTPNELVQNPGY